MSNVLVAWLKNDNACDVSHLGTVPEFTIDTSYGDHSRFAIDGTGLYVTSIPPTGNIISTRILMKDFAGRYADEELYYSIYLENCTCASTTTTSTTTTGTTTTGTTTTSTTAAPTACFNKYGDDIFGTSGGDQLGRTVDMSDNGTFVVVSSPEDDDSGSNAGKVQVFRWTGVAWTQRGSDILGDSVNDYLGEGIRGKRGVAINNDGTIIAVSSELGGYVKVYEWGGSDWSQKGSTLSGTSIGSSVDLNNDGSILAVGNTTTSSNTGSVNIYEWSGSAWSQKGSTILGESSNDGFGYSLCLNSAGDFIAIGGPYNDTPTANAGHIRVYQFSGGNWSQKGQELDGNSDAAGGLFGSSVSISDDGLTVAGSGPETGTGYVKVYSFSSTHGIWLSKGSDISEGSSTDGFGYSIALDGDGNSIVVGSIYSDPTTGVDAGKVRLFEWNGSSWVKNCTDIDGDGAGDRFGFCVSISSDSNHLAVGGPKYDNGSNYNAGHIRTYSKTYLNPSSMPDEYFGSADIINLLP
tara:strand:- start:1369 stop:2931 length:1563 start_codon:yes stop_codon:yes gene_type:complete